MTAARNIKTVLVTGATGGLGRNAVDYLLAKGLNVRATGRNLQIGAAIEASGAEFIWADLANTTPEGISHLVKGIDVVWHCAALSAPWGQLEDFMSANVRATDTLLTAAGLARVKDFVHISTPAIYFGYKHHLGIREDYRADRYVNAYAMTKAAAESCVQQNVGIFRSMKQVILRPRAIFGPHDQVLVPRLSDAMRKYRGRLPLPRGGATVLDMTYVENVVHAMWLATVAPVRSGSVYNITNDNPLPLKDVLHWLFVTHLDRPLHIKDVPYGLLSKAAAGMEFLSRLTKREPNLTRYSVGAMAFDMTLDIQRAKNELRYAPVVSMEEGIRRTAAWIKQNDG